VAKGYDIQGESTSKEFGVAKCCMPSCGKSHSNIWPLPKTLLQLSIGRCQLLQNVSDVGDILQVQPEPKLILIVIFF
jgi:hypothetical protein